MHDDDLFARFKITPALDFGIFITPKSRDLEFRFSPFIPDKDLNRLNTIAAAIIMRLDKQGLFTKLRNKPKRALRAYPENSNSFATYQNPDAEVGRMMFDHASDVINKIIKAVKEGTPLDDAIEERYRMEEARIDAELPEQPHHQHHQSTVIELRHEPFVSVGLETEGETVKVHLRPTLPEADHARASQLIETIIKTVCERHDINATINHIPSHHSQILKLQNDPENTLYELISKSLKAISLLTDPAHEMPIIEALETALADERDLLKVHVEKTDEHARNQSMRVVKENLLGALITKAGIGLEDAVKIINELSPAIGPTWREGFDNAANAVTSFYLKGEDATRAAGVLKYYARDFYSGPER